MISLGQLQMKLQALRNAYRGLPGTMTLATFLERLKGLGREWVRYPDGRVRCTSGECPIVAVAADTVFGDELQAGANGHAHEIAVSALGLTIGDASLLLFAADGCPGCTSAERVSPLADAIKAQLHAACGV
jgi:hypothetical protein